MHGTIKWQVIELTKTIFEQNIIKDDRNNPNHEYYQYVTYDKTMQEYIYTWMELGNFVRINFGMKDMLKINSKHIESYFNHIAMKYLSINTLQKKSSGIGKLEFALNTYSKINCKNNQYNFDVRFKIVREIKEFGMAYNNYHNRAYEDPKQIIKNIDNDLLRLVATIQLEGGCRIGGLHNRRKTIKIKTKKLKDNLLFDKVAILETIKDKSIVNVLQGVQFDPVFLAKGIKKKVGVILTVEKGKKPGLVYISTETYKKLEAYYMDNESLKFNQHAYYKILEKISNDLGYQNEASHAFRWNHIQAFQRELINAGYGYEEALLINSLRHKHWRKNITNHYFG